MRKKLLALHVGYYVLCLLTYVGVFHVLTNTFMFITGWGGLLYVDYLLLAATPIITAILTRFSLLKRYVDPIATAEVLLAIYILTKMYGWSMTVYDLVAGYHENISVDSGKGWLFFVGLYVVGLAASFSFARKRGESISFRVLSKFPALNQFQYVE